MNDPIQVVFNRGKFNEKGASVDKLQTYLEEMIQKLWLPQYFLPVVKEEEKLQYPLKELLIWAVLSKK